VHVHAGIGAPPTLLWPSPDARGGETVAARGGAGGIGAALALLSMMVAVLLCWKGASAWQQMRLNARVVVDAEDGCGREEESDIMFKLSRVLQM
tara:strand:+ start:241 stop:522 length:282 start_codon:yes stop_codon:yes gene_type:complete